MTKDIKFYDSSKTPGIVAGGIISAGIDTYSHILKTTIVLITTTHYRLLSILP